MIKNLCLALTLATLSVAASCTTTDKKLIIQKKLDFIECEKDALEQMNMENRAIYKQAKWMAQQGLQEKYTTTKKQIKDAINQIIASEEFAYYNSYTIIFKASLIAYNHLKAKKLPTIRLDQPLATKINEILGSTIPAKLLQRIEVITLFETLLNYTVDTVESQAITALLNQAEEQLTSWLAELEGNTDALKA